MSSISSGSDLAGRDVFDLQSLPFAGGVTRSNAGKGMKDMVHFHGNGKKTKSGFFLKITRHILSEKTKMPLPKGSKPDPFDSDSDSELVPKRGKSVQGKSAYQPASAADKKRYKNGFKDEGGLENQSVQELENYAAYKAEETTEKVNDCLKIAELIKEDASNTLVMLHQQGEQIHRTHETAVTIDKDLSKGETILGSLGGFFSKPWKPKKSHHVKGPATTDDISSHKHKKGKKEHREKLGLSGNTPGHQRHYSEPTSAMEKVQIEKEKQDDTLTDISDVLGQLKGMATDMGTEIDRQNKALDSLHEDVDELNNRMKGANDRARKLLAK